MTELSVGLQAIFENHKKDFQRRVGTLDEAVAASLAGRLGEELRASAERDAHKLAGSLGTFGLPRGSELARALEHRLSRPHWSFQADETDLIELVSALRSELDSPPAAQHPGGKLGIYSSGSAFTGDAPGSQPPATTPGLILVVDDDIAIRHALTQILADAGHDLRDVGSAREARYALETEPIALLLSDVSMPGETGLDLIRFALCEYPHTATLLISALEDPGIAQVAMDFGAYGYLTKPVRRSEVLIGVMNALRRREMEARERAARETLERTVQVRTRALSLAMQRLEAADERVLQAETIHGWALAAEYRDPGIASHVKRVGRCCALLGHKLGLHDSLELASMLHDVGKTAISDRILRKPGPLTADERLAVEAHAEIGYVMLSGSRSSLLDLAAEIAMTHHEKFDGSGYPRGLAGIPLEGRIAAVADVFDAMTCNRVYRPAWSVQATITWNERRARQALRSGGTRHLLASMDEILGSPAAPASR